MTQHRRAHGAPRRAVTSAQVRRNILVFTEGRVTEEQYLVDWRRRFRDVILITIDEFHGGPDPYGGPLEVRAGQNLAPLAREVLLVRTDGNGTGILELIEVYRQLIKHDKVVKACARRTARGGDTS